MNFNLTDEQSDLAAASKKLSQSFSLDYWSEIDANHSFPQAYWDTLNENGYLGLSIPEEYGGSGAKLFEMALTLEALASGGGGLGASFMFVANNFGIHALLSGGTDAQKKKYLPGMADGTRPACMALTEPNAGSNTLAITTKAERKDDKWVINGQKVFISNASWAKFMLIVARTTPMENLKKKTGGLTLFIVDDPKDNPAITIRPIEKIAMRYTDSNEVWFDNLELPLDSIVGQVDEGWQFLVDILNPERVGAAATCLGIAEVALGLGVKYASERKVFGRLIGSNQGLQFPMADAKARMDCARLMMYKACWLYDQGLPCDTEANTAKYVAAEAAFSACDWALQCHGGFGIAKEYYVERLWRDARLLKITPISQQLALAQIGTHVLGLPRSF